MTRTHSIADTFRHALVALSVVVSSTAGVAGATEPNLCVSPKVNAPAPYAGVPVNYSLPQATTINVRDHGAKGDGSTNDTPALQSIVDSNPHGNIYLPAGNYVLHNGSFNQAGLKFQNFHGNVVMQAGGRFVCDTIAIGVAGQCVHVLNSTGASFANFQIGYQQNSQLPWSRSQAGNNALLVETSQNLWFMNTTIEASTGSGIWVTGSDTIHFKNGTSISNTAADGLHFENSGNSTVWGFFSQNTGDDGLSATIYQDSLNNGNPVRCGLTAGNIQIYRSLSRGITVAGACNVWISNFYIDTTANSGIGVAQDPNFRTLLPTNSNFTNGTILNSGRYSSPVVSGKDCIDIAASTGTTVTNVGCVNPLISGAFVFGGATNVQLSGVTVDASPNLGFGINESSNVRLINTVSRGSAGGGYVFNSGFNGGSMTGAYACNSGKYGFYHAQVSNIAESNLTSYDSSEGNSSNRVWWAEGNSNNISLNGMHIYDDQTHNNMVVGAAGVARGTVTINGVSIASALASVLTQLP